MKKQIEHELKRLLKFEKIAFESIVFDNLNDLELKYIIEKIFEANDMIVRLQKVLKELENR